MVQPVFVLYTLLNIRVRALEAESSGKSKACYNDFTALLFLRIKGDVTKAISFEHIVQCALCLFQIFEILHRLL